METFTAQLLDGMMTGMGAKKADKHDLCDIHIRREIFMKR